MKVTLVTQPFPSHFHRVQEMQKRTRPGFGVLAYIGSSEHKPPGFEKLISAAQLIFDDIHVWWPDLEALAGLDSDLLDVAHKATNKDGCAVLFDKERLRPYVQEVVNESFRRTESRPSRGRLAKRAERLNRLIDDSQNLAILRSALVPLDDLDDSHDTILLSPDAAVNREYLLRRKSLSADNILMVLATSGVAVTLPAVAVPDSDTLSEVKDKHKSDREEYIAALRKYVKECYERVKSGDYEDAWRYAEIASNQDLLIACHNFERAVKSTDARLLKRVVVGFPEGVPNIASAMLKGTGEAVRATYIEILKILCASLAQHTLEKDLNEKFPGMSYVYAVRKALAASGTANQ